MNKKLKIYSILLALVLVVTVVSNTFHQENFTSIHSDGEILKLDSLTEEFAKIDKKVTTRVDTINSKPDTITTTTWNVDFKPTFELTFPVRQRGSATDKYLYSILRGEPCMVEMKQVKFKVPFEKTSPDFMILHSLLFLSTLPLCIWMLVIVLKVIRSVYKGEIFVTQIAKRLETAGKLLVAIWLLNNVIGYVQIEMIRKAVHMAYYDIYWQFSIDYNVIFGLILMILSQIILKGKDLKEEQELTI